MGSVPPNLPMHLPILTRLGLRSKPVIPTSGGARRLRGVSSIPAGVEDRIDMWRQGDSV